MKWKQCGSRKILHWQLLEFLCHLLTNAWWLSLTIIRSYFVWRIQTVISTAIVSLLLRINNQNDMIDNAIRIVRETEDVSLEIERELARNREKINASREKVSLRCIRIFWVEICHGMPRNQWCDCAIPDDARILLRKNLHVEFFSVMLCLNRLITGHLNHSSYLILQVGVFSGVTDSARRVLTSMARRDVKQRFILAFIAAVLIIAIAVTIYYTTQKNKK